MIRAVSTCFTFTKLRTHIEISTIDVVRNTSPSSSAATHLISGTIVSPGFEFESDGVFEPRNIVLPSQMCTLGYLGMSVHSAYSCIQSCL